MPFLSGGAIQWPLPAKKGLMCSMNFNLTLEPSMMPPSLMCLLEVYLGNIYCLHVGNVCLFVHPSICPKAKITQPLRIIPICHHACICISLHLPVPFWIFLYLPAFLWISLDLSDLSHHNYQPSCISTH